MKKCVKIIMSILICLIVLGCSREVKDDNTSWKTELTFPILSEKMLYQDMDDTVNKINGVRESLTDDERVEILYLEKYKPVIGGNISDGKYREGAVYGLFFEEQVMNAIMHGDPDDLLKSSEGMEALRKHYETHEGLSFTLYAADMDKLSSIVPLTERGEFGKGRLFSKEETENGDYVCMMYVTYPFLYGDIDTTDIENNEIVLLDYYFSDGELVHIEPIKLKVVCLYTYRGVGITRPDAIYVPVKTMQRIENRQTELTGKYGVNEAQTDGSFKYLLKASQNSKKTCTGKIVIQVKGKEAYLEVMEYLRKQLEAIEGISIISEEVLN